MRTGKGLRAYLLSLGLVALASLLGEFVQRFLNPTNLVMIYLLAVVIAATLWGRGASVTVAVLSVIAFDFLFVPPRFTFTVEDTQYLLTFAGLLVVGLVISELASKTRARALEAQSREIQTMALYGLSKDLVSILALEKAMPIVLSHMKRVASAEVSLRLEEGEKVRSWSSSPGLSPLPAELMTTISVRTHQSAGPPEAAGRRDFPPFPFPTGTVSGTLLTFSVHLPGGKLSPEKRQLLEAMSHQAALAVERLRLLEESRQMALFQETEKLQSALLHSISHDLRTPLVSITGSLSALLHSSGKGRSPSSRRELIETAYEESVRLNRQVGRMLDMARIESGAVRVRRKPCDIRDIIAVSLDELKDKLAGRPVRIRVGRNVGDVAVDFFLLSKVLANVLDNAAKYSPRDSTIDLTVRKERGILRIMVRDHGCGIPRRDLERIFNKFYRVKRDPDIQGTGLGLSISRGIVELHGGKIRAESLEDRGTTVIIQLPLQGRMTP